MWSKIAIVLSSIFLPVHYTVPLCVILYGKMRVDEKPDLKSDRNKSFTIPHPWYSEFLVTGTFFFLVNRWGFHFTDEVRYQNAWVGYVIPCALEEILYRGYFREQFGEFGSWLLYVIKPARQFTLQNPATRAWIGSCRLVTRRDSSLFSIIWKVILVESIAHYSRVMLT